MSYQYWYKIHEEKVNKFNIVASWSYEDTPIRHCFDESCHDIQELEQLVENGTYQWFILRVQAFLNGAEIGNHYIGGCMYEKEEDVLTDGTYEDCKIEAINEAKKWLEDALKAI